MGLPAVHVLPPVSINVFTRVPEPGRVKTRLIPAIGAHRAAALLRCMTRITLARAREADIGPVTLWCTPAPDATLRTLAGEFEAESRVQLGADLGERMHHALQKALDEHAAALVLGTDCPFISVGDLERTRSLLFEHDNRVVLGPAHDGGYYLLAARAVHASLFAGVPWGGGEVLERTRGRLDAMGWSWAELETKHDIDRPEDLAYVRSLPELAHFDATPAGNGPGACPDLPRPSPKGSNPHRSEKKKH